ncbi:MAG TPA: hypothetical protein PKL65_05100 [Bacteroidales bacterium]|nr:hypothetical protein [Bacteroidales bacterium]HNR41588.1 hypothetical protein [Bacteroidales bacterium]HPM17929.1 hypothetical protein [Bacteroidales bacterium]HQG76894.1 hypothetical protein [Bacteroidales bacterium]
MEKIKINMLRFAGVVVLGFGLRSFVVCQAPVQDILPKSTLRDQMNYVQEKTRIYDNYRAIREDVFQQIKRNSLDSLQVSKTEITRLKVLAESKNREIDSLNSTLSAREKELQEMTTFRNSIRLFGIEVDKRTYKGIMWLVIAILSIILISGFLSYKRNRIVTHNTRKEFEDLKKEFEAYRKASREAREKMSMAHFNELKKLRTG